MKTICLYFQVHQPFRYRKYRFFDIGNDHYYYDDYANETILRKVAVNCYLPANKMLLEAINKHQGKFKVAFSLSGIAIEQFELYAPEVLTSFQKLAQTGCVEFLSETYSHSLSVFKDMNLFAEQIKHHDLLIEKYFGQKPTVFRNTELIYSNEIGDFIQSLGFKAMLAEGAKHVLGWKSPNFLYCSAVNPRLKVLFRNFKLSDDISFRFSNKGWSEFPLTAQKFVNWLLKTDSNEEVVNLFMDYESIGEHQKSDTGIFDFFKAMVDEVVKEKTLSFSTPSEIVDTLHPISAVNVHHPISWADEERDLSAWLGNDLQEEAYNKLYQLAERMTKCTNHDLIKDWHYLQISDHFYYMCTKFFSDGEVHKYFNPYESAYEAFTNYMNVFSDFKLRLDSFVPESTVDLEISRLKKIIDERNEQIKRLENEQKRLGLRDQKRAAIVSKGKNDDEIKLKAKRSSDEESDKKKTIKSK